MPKKRLNDKTVRGLTAQAGRSSTDYWDTNLSGFGVRVFATGRKTWFVRYRVNGKQVRPKLGQYPDIGVAEAREMAKDKMRESAPGSTDGTTVSRLVELYLELHAPKKRASSRIEDERMLEKDILPALGNSRLTEI